jgi:predicted TIM-barrel fold metal-dependent hydrolase
VNEELSEAVAETPDRFEALAILPLQDTDASVRELDRAMNELGLKGFLVASHVDGRRWDDDALFPVLEEAERTGAFIIDQNANWPISGEKPPSVIAHGNRNATSRSKMMKRIDTR